MNGPNVEPQSQHLTIRIRGHLSDRLIENFEALQIKHLPNGDSLIFGEVEDQAQLFGLLIQFRDLGIPLLEIKCCDQNFTPQELHNEDN